MFNERIKCSPGGPTDLERRPRPLPAPPRRGGCPDLILFQKREVVGDFGAGETVGRWGRRSLGPKAVGRSFIGPVA